MYYFWHYQFLPLVGITILVILGIMLIKDIIDQTNAKKDH